MEAILLGELVVRAVEMAGFLLIPLSLALVYSREQAPLSPAEKISIILLCLLSLNRAIFLQPIPCVCLTGSGS